MSNRYISTVFRTIPKQKDEPVASRYLLSLRSINDKAKSHDSRIVTERNLISLFRKNHYDYYQTII
jgi:hypothetical protein